MELGEWTEKYKKIISHVISKYFRIVLIISGFIYYYVIQRFSLNFGSHVASNMMER